MAAIEEGIEEEMKLAEQMKDEYCDESGKETYPAKAAEIIHQIGQIYRKRSPDKISLIKSAGLFNAAIIRNPSNVAQIKSDLSEICQHTLQQAEARQQNADLVKKAEQIKSSMNVVRDKICVSLKTDIPKITEDFHNLILNKIAKIQQLNITIADKYKEIMADICQFCEDVMGTPPCEYAVVGMGSLAREEITPYSDFEHIILLLDGKNYKTHLNYFRWFSVIFHIIILNFGETIIPSLNLSSLNDKDSRLGNWYYDATTPRGIAFDGMMPHASKFPLGRSQHTKNKPFTTELIKPVSEMLEYLNSKADLKNGYHLADILTKTCFVFGSKTIFKQFVNGAQKQRNQKSQTDIINDVKQQVKDDLNSFSTRFRLTDLRSQKTINIKQLVYRSTTIFIAALARLYNISENSSFGIIKEMAKSNKITHNTAHKLQSAIAIACEVRLRVYMEKKSQCDNAIDLKQESIEKFLDIVGTASTVNYFQIAYCLQCEVAKQLKFTKLHFYSDPNLINITIGLAFGIKNLASFSENPQKRFWDSNEFDFDECIDQVEKRLSKKFSFKVFSRNEDPLPVQSKLRAKQIKSIADYLLEAEIYDEAVDFYKQLLNIYQRESKNNNHRYYVSIGNHQNLPSSNKLEQPHKTSTNVDRSLLIDQNAMLHAEEDKKIATTLHNIGRCYIDLHIYDEALLYLNRALEIKRNISRIPEKDKDVATTLHTIGRCCIELHNHEEALTYLNQALTIRQKITLNAEKDRDIATTVHNIGFCHIDLYKYKEALTYLNQALKIRQNATPNAEKDRDIAETLHAIGSCHIDLHNYDEALPYLNRALEIRQQSTFNAQKDMDIALTLQTIGRCHIYLHNCSAALKYLNQALNIKQNTTLVPEKDRYIASTLYFVGICHNYLHDHEEALTNLIQALKIKQNTTRNAEKDKDIAKTLYTIGCCHIDLDNYDEALTYLNRALKIKQNTTLNAEKDEGIAATLHKIGWCYNDLHHYHEALQYLNRALNIKQNTTPNAEKDKQLASILHCIDRCQSNLNNHDEALAKLN